MDEKVAELGNCKALFGTFLKSNREKIFCTQKLYSIVQHVFLGVITFLIDRLSNSISYLLLQGVIQKLRGQEEGEGVSIENPHMIT